MSHFKNIFKIVVLALFGLAANAQPNPANFSFVETVCAQEIDNLSKKEPFLGSSTYIRTRLGKDAAATRSDAVRVRGDVTSRDTDPDRGYFMLCVLSARSAMLQKPDSQAADVAKNWQSSLRPSLEASTGVKFGGIVQTQQTSSPQAVVAQRVEPPPREVASARSISGMPALYEARPDPDRPGRHLAFALNGCALSFAQPAVRGLRWSGGCVDSRMHGVGTVLGVDYEKQPTFFFDGQIERGLRIQGFNYEFERRNGQFTGSRTPVVNGQLQQPIDIPFLELPRPFLFALDDWQRQLSGENFLASLGAVWATGYQEEQRRRQSREQGGAGASGGIYPLGTDAPSVCEVPYGFENARPAKVSAKHNSANSAMHCVCINRDKPVSGKPMYKFQNLCSFTVDLYFYNSPGRYKLGGNVHARGQGNDYAYTAGDEAFTYYFCKAGRTDVTGDISRAVIGCL